MSAVDNDSARPILILGTGRCGSTLVSEIVRLHPSMLSISELFSFTTDLGNRIARVFPEGKLSGEEFWEVMSDPQPRQTTLLVNDLAMPEVLYPWSSGRFDRGYLPPILTSLIPHLAPEDPDDLFDRLGKAMRGNPAAIMPDHLRRMFRWLQRRENASTWVERSGGSLRVAKRLINAFPEAKVVHLVRDGRDTALSMSRHIGFRMAFLCSLQSETLGVDPYETTDRSDEADLTDELAELLPENFSREAFDAFDLPPSLCGHYWSGEIVEGLKALANLDRDSLLTLRYEDLLSDPTGVIGRFADFSQVEVTDQWLSEASSLVRPQLPRWPALAPDELAALEAACALGTEALEGAICSSSASDQARSNQ